MKYLVEIRAEELDGRICWFGIVNGQGHEAKTREQAVRDAIKGLRHFNEAEDEIVLKTTRRTLEIAMATFGEG